MNVQTDRAPQQKYSTSSDRKKEVAKFFSGFGANQVLVHGALALNGVTFSVFGNQYTPTFNGFATAIWAVITALLMLYAWHRD